MPRPSKGPRLWLQPARKRNGGVERAVWIIRDGAVKRSTGAGARDLRQAETALASYIISKSKAPRTSNRDPASIKVADVIAIYSEDIVSKHARPHETAQRLSCVVRFCEGMTLADLGALSTDAYVDYRGGRPVARRELEDLRSAVRYHWKRGLCSSLTPVSLPERGAPRSRWLTRKEAAALLKAARKVGHHVARFVLVGLYTGTRASAICGAALASTPGRSWIDLDHGVFFRRAQGQRETKKRQPAVRLPPRLLAHLRRWQAKRLMLRSVIEFQGCEVRRVNKAFRSAVILAGLDKSVTPHTLRHTCATWLAHAGVPVWEAAGFLGMTVEMFETTYGHQHPDFQSRAVNAFGPRQFTDRNTVNERERSRSNVVKMHGKH